jgi:nucleoside-diphosphate-sugar epimerase
MPTPPILGKRIVVTGGSGVAGRHVIEKLLSYGHEILNVDVVPLENSRVYTLKADLTDGAQAFNSLSCHFKVSEPFMDAIGTPDAVVHFAGKYYNLFLNIVAATWKIGEVE